MWDTLSQESLVGAFCSPAEQTDLTDLAKQFYLQRAILLCSRGRVRQQEQYWSNYLLELQLPTVIIPAFDNLVFIGPMVDCRKICDVREAPPPSLGRHRVGHPPAWPFPRHSLPAPPLLFLQHSLQTSFWNRLSAPLSIYKHFLPSRHPRHAFDCWKREEKSKSLYHLPNCITAQPFHSLLRIDTEFSTESVLQTSISSAI